MREVVITGLGLVSPIGVEKDEFFRAHMCEGQSGVGVLAELSGTTLASRIGARVGDSTPRNTSNHAGTSRS